MYYLFTLLEDYEGVFGDLSEHTTLDEARAVVAAFETTFAASLEKINWRIVEGITVAQKD